MLYKVTFKKKGTKILKNAGEENSSKWNRRTDCLQRNVKYVVCLLPFPSCILCRFLSLMVSFSLTALSTRKRRNYDIFIDKEIMLASIVIVMNVMWSWNRFTICYEGVLDYEMKKKKKTSFHGNFRYL